MHGNRQTYTDITITAVDAQCYRKGLKNIEVNFEPDRTVTYFTSSGVPEGLGDSFFIDVHYGRQSCESGERVCRVAPVMTDCLTGYIERKRQCLVQSSCEGNTYIMTLNG